MFSASTTWTLPHIWEETSGGLAGWRTGGHLWGGRHQQVARMLPVPEDSCFQHRSFWCLCWRYHFRTKPAASSTLSGISARSERILEEWWFICYYFLIKTLKLDLITFNNNLIMNFLKTFFFSCLCVFVEVFLIIIDIFVILISRNFKNNKTALLMLKRAQKMKSRKQQQKNHWGKCS